MAGRKGFYEELKLLERYSELSVEYFSFLKTMFASGDKNDKKWASERIEKAYVKMIPQDLNIPEGITVKIVNYGNSNTLQLPTENLSVASTPSTSTLQDSSATQESWEIKDSPKPADNQNPA